MKYELTNTWMNDKVEEPEGDEMQRAKKQPLQEKRMNVLVYVDVVMYMSFTRCILHKV